MRTQLSPREQLQQNQIEQQVMQQNIAKMMQQISKQERQPINPFQKPLFQKKIRKSNLVYQHSANQSSDNMRLYNSSGQFAVCSTTDDRRMSPMKVTNINMALFDSYISQMEQIIGNLQLDLQQLKNNTKSYIEQVFTENQPYMQEELVGTMMIGLKKTMQFISENCLRIDCMSGDMPYEQNNINEKNIYAVNQSEQSKFKPNINHNFNQQERQKYYHQNADQSRQKQRSNKKYVRKEYKQQMPQNQYYEQQNDMYLINQSHGKDEKKFIQKQNHNNYKSQMMEKIPKKNKLKCSYHMSTSTLHTKDGHLIHSKYYPGQSRLSENKSIYQSILEEREMRIRKNRKRI